MILKLITFDVTGTIVQLRETVGYQYAKIAAHYNVNVSSNLLTKNFYFVFKKMLVQYPNFGGNEIGWQDWWRKLVIQVFQDSLPASTIIEPATFDKISSDLIEIYKTGECWKLADGAQSLMDKLNSKKIRLGVISNYDPRLESILEDLKVRKYFSFVLDSYTAKSEKPDCAIFKIVEDMNLDVKKSEILHIGDNPKLDFMGARNMGWNALLITKNLTELDEKFPTIEADWVVENVGEVYETLDRKKLL